MLSPQNILQQGVPCTPCCFLSQFLPQVPFDAPQYFGCRRQRPQSLTSWGESEARHHTPASPPSFQAEAGHGASRCSPLPPYIAISEHPAQGREREKHC